jgi:hypothetical protein
MRDDAIKNQQSVSGFGIHGHDSGAAWLGNNNESSETEKGTGMIQ